MASSFRPPPLWPHLTVEQNIRFGLAHLTTQEARARVSYYLVHTSLAGMAKRFPAQLSGGEARRVSIARALALQPQFLLMDEPLTNLDYELKQTILELIIAEQQLAGCCLVYVTHDLEEAARVSPRITRMPGGKHV